MEEKILDPSHIEELFAHSNFCIERDSNYDPERAMWGEAIQY
ncbi:conserved hypothetical protein [Cupriavidus necator]|uniref:Uncharacterized protein n=1 Tax=Cupriavidus necator TaxID=106590 RepID=A0A1K0J1Y6_CUPNE|nr:conserved hypothetical protein [Cupriavidus necator]